MAKTTGTHRKSIKTNRPKCVDINRQNTGKISRKNT